MLTVTLTACAELGLTFSKAKTDVMRLQTKGAGKVSFAVTTVGKEYKRPTELVFLRGVTSKYSGLRGAVVRLVLRVWACFRRYNIEKTARAFAYERRCEC